MSQSQFSQLSDYCWNKRYRENSSDHHENQSPSSSSLGPPSRYCVSDFSALIWCFMSVCYVCHDCNTITLLVILYWKCTIKIELICVSFFTSRHIYYIDVFLLRWFYLFYLFQLGPTTIQPLEMIICFHLFVLFFMFLFICVCNINKISITYVCYILFIL